MADVDGLIFGGLIKNEDRFWNSIFASLVGMWLIVALVAGTRHTLRIGVSYWELTHIVLAGAVGTAVLAYSTYFVRVITDGRLLSIRMVAWRVFCYQLSLIGFYLGRADRAWGVLADCCAILTCGVLMWQAVAMTRAINVKMAPLLKASVPYFVLALLFLFYSMIFLLMMGHGLGRRSFLVQAHAQAAVWGFGWFAVIGAALPLVPRLTGIAVKERVIRRAERALGILVFLLLIMTTLQALNQTILVGAVMVAFVGVSIIVLHPLLSDMLGSAEHWHGSALGLTASLVWLIALQATQCVILLLGFDSELFFYLVIPALAGAGYLQFVLSALHHLLPFSWGQSATADPSAFTELVLINLGAVLTLFGFSGNAMMIGLVLIAIGVASKFSILIRYGISVLVSEKS
ncbi:hypothetical protein [Corynebacterium epidermidicanis]|uniref:Uncharacterized protein n=1 Tax=Corynebacterium epidermidicanis TaxID=1050174 RepID=A0A0G3GVI6_9CORY|nr:hypothetical protein [Corynebacterium epidermidicanis]AKK02872.1 hypothetical protein CEPID_05015 [Corynebacterium epidermidicanis]